MAGEERNVIRVITYEGWRNSVSISEGAEREIIRKAPGPRSLSVYIVRCVCEFAAYLGGPSEFPAALQWLEEQQAMSRGKAVESAVWWRSGRDSFVRSEAI